MKKKLIIMTTVILVLSITTLAYWLNQPKQPENKTVKIGFVAPLSGEAAIYGKYAIKSFDLAIDDFNASHKLQLEVIYEDGQCNGKTATAAINKLINIDQVQYIIGGLCSSETLAMAPIAKSNKIILLSPGSSSPDITQAGDYIFRNLASDDYTAKEIAKLAIKNKDNKIVILTEETDYPQTLKKAFINYYTNNGGEIFADETFNSNDKDFKSIITKLKDKQVDSLYLVTQNYQNSDLILKQMKELDYQPKLYTSEATINIEALNYYKQNYKEITENAIFTQPKFDENNPKTKELLDKIKDKYQTLEGPTPTVYLATYYDSVFLLGEAIEKKGDSPEQVKNYFYQIKNWPGTVGNFSFDQNGDAVTEVEAKTVINNQIVDYK